jgi:hypothetical protein
MGGQKCGVREGLRGLRAPQSGARGRGVGHPLRLAPQGIYHRLSGDGALAGSGMIEQGGEKFRPGEGAGGVVDQHGLGRQVRKRLQRQTHRIGAFRAAMHRRQQARVGQVRHRRSIDFICIRVDGNQHSIQLRTSQRRAQGPRQHHLATDTLVLLRHRAAQARAPAGGDDDGGCGHSAPSLHLSAF